MDVLGLGSTVATVRYTRIDGQGKCCFLALCNDSQLNMGLVYCLQLKNMVQINLPSLWEISLNLI